MERRSATAIVSAALGLAALTTAALGPILVHAAGYAPLAGFRLVFPLGVAAALLAVLVGLVGLLRTRRGSGRVGRPLAWLGIATGALLLAVVGTAAGAGIRKPAINDITTSPDEPPSFEAAREAPENRDRDMTYPPEFAAIQREAYPELGPIRVSSPPERSLALARQTAESLGWEVVAVDADDGRLEARDTSRLFRFVDDVVVRVRPGEGGGSVVDVRSKSRDGRGDLGANAARIRRFLSELPR